MLVEAAVGDAYGSGFEFADREVIQQFNDGRHYRNHVFWLNLTSGMYTDDTQMSIAVAETLITKSYSKLGFANAFIRCFKRDPREGYSSRFFELLLKLDSGSDLLARMDPKSTRCGAAMRSLPIGFLPLDRIEPVAEMQASVTHNTEEGILSSKAMALASHFMRTQKDPTGVRKWVQKRLGTRKFGKKWTKEVSVEADDVVNAVFTVLENATDFKDVLVRSIEFGGDVDTVASLAAGLASPVFPMDSVMLVGLERSQFSHKYIRELEQQLESLVF